MVEHQFSHPRVAALYDTLHPPCKRADFAFYLPLIMAAESVLDVGCGTGALLHMAREAGHAGHLVGLDPGDGMLAHARTRSDIEWIRGDLASIAWQRQFDLVVMTGHAFQVLLSDRDIQIALATIGAALTDAGRFVFETRNPKVREWERWTPERVVRVVDDDGALLGMAREVATQPDGDVVSFTSTFTSTGWDRPEVSHSTLRFLDVGSLSSRLGDAGLAVQWQFGDWDRQPVRNSSPEIITCARRA